MRRDGYTALYESGEAGWDTGGLGLTLAREAEGHVIHDGHGGRRRLDSSGWLWELEDASGNRITVERDPYGRISRGKGQLRQAHRLLL